MITSIFNNGEFTFVPGMKKLSDFEVINWFDDFPALKAMPFAGYYFGKDATDIAINNFDLENAAVEYGSLDNKNGFISADVDNYLDTQVKAPLKLTIGARIRRPAVPSGSLWFIGDYSGLGATGVGFAVGVGVDGKLRAAAQNTGVAQTTIASVDFPASIAVGDVVALTAYIRNGTVTIAVYNPETQEYDSNAVGMGGERAEGTANIFIGRKVDNNATTLSTDIGAIVMIDGELTTAEHIAVQQYLYNMA